MGILFYTVGLFSVEKRLVLDNLDSSSSGSRSPILYLLFIDFRGIVAAVEGEIQIVTAQKW